MIPILFDKTATSFSNNGIGRLIDAISCKVTEQRNSSYELVLQYPTCGALYSYLQEGCIVMAKANDINKPQCFRIYKTGKPVRGISTVYARHISYDLSGVPIMALSLEKSTPVQIWNASGPLLEHPFTFESDIKRPLSILSPLPRSLRNLLGGEKDSLLTVFGGELEFDNHKVILHAERGSNASLRIRYGKNITTAEQERNINDMYTHLLPYALVKNTEDDTETVIKLSTNDGLIQLIDPSVIGHQKAYIVDLSNMFTDDEEINEANLQTHAEEYIEQHDLTTPLVNIKITLDDVSQAADSFRLAPRETLGLCDWVYVYFEGLDVTAFAQVIKTEYDSIAERMTAIEVGSTKSTLSDTVSSIKESVRESVEISQDGLTAEEKRANAALQAAITEATNKITGQSGGYVVQNPPNNPYEILVMDSPDISKALNLWRWNSAGLGHSSDGYDGPYGTAITMDGKIVADYITAGTLRAIDVSGCHILGGTININDRFIVDTLGNVTIKSGAIDDLGCRNLILNSGKEYSSATYLMRTYTPSEPLTAGEKHTISMCVTPAEGVTHFAPHVSNGTKWLCDLKVSGTEKQIVKATFTMGYKSGKTPTDDISNANIGLYRYPNDGTITAATTVHWIKVEKGGTATDWTPAPEDVEASLMSISADRIVFDGQTIDFNVNAISTSGSLQIKTKGPTFCVGVDVNYPQVRSSNYQTNKSGEAVGIMAAGIYYENCVPGNGTIPIRFGWSETDGFLYRLAGHWKMDGRLDLSAENPIYMDNQACYCGTIVLSSGARLTFSNGILTKVT